MWHSRKYTGRALKGLIDNQLETDPTKITEGFNTYFSSIAEKLQQNVSFGVNNFTKYLKTPLDNNFLFKSVDTNEIILIIDSLENSKATGPHVYQLKFWNLLNLIYVILWKT